MAPSTNQISSIAAAHLLDRLPRSVLEMGDDEEEQQYDRFNVDNDFSDGQWIGGEFFHAGRKQKRQQREEDRLYGVFAEGSDSEDEGRRSRRKGGGGDRGAADYSAPVGFVSSGVVNKQQPEEEAAAAAPQGAYDVQGPPGLGSGGGQQGGAGLGAGLGSSGGGGGGGLGFRSAGAQNGSGDADMEQRRREEEEGDEEEGVLGTALGARCVFRAWGGWAHGVCVYVCVHGLHGMAGACAWRLHGGCMEVYGLHGGLWA